METLEGLEQAEGERGQTGALHPTGLLFSPLHPLLFSSPEASVPHTRWQPPPCVPSTPILRAYILGVKGIVAATAELVAALGAVEMHAASSGQCV